MTTKESIPKAALRWNWGAFFLGPFWGVANRTYLGLLWFVPFMPFVLGASGGEWAWKNGQWKSVEEFERMQSAWAMAGMLTFVGFVMMVGALAVALLGVR
jgi:hypothetical protein